MRMMMISCLVLEGTELWICYNPNSLHYPSSAFWLTLKKSELRAFLFNCNTRLFLGQEIKTIWTKNKKRKRKRGFELWIASLLLHITLLRLTIRLTLEIQENCFIKKINEKVTGPTYNSLICKNMWL